MKNQLLISNIEWDTDGADVDLPKTALIDVSSHDDLNDQVAESLSKEFGYCVLSFDFEAQTQAQSQTAHIINEPVQTQFPSSEGWDLFEVEGKLEIQRDDEMEIFASDEEAIAHVTRMAQAGSQIHQEALSLHLTDAVKPAATRGLRM